MEENEQQPAAIHEGFPNPAVDMSLAGLDLNRRLITHAASTFIFKVQGNDWQESGIFDGDLALVDRALDARRGDIVLWWSETVGHFTLSKLRAVPTGAMIWGVVTSIIHEFRKQQL